MSMTTISWYLLDLACQSRFQAFKGVGRRHMTVVTLPKTARDLFIENMQDRLPFRYDTYANCYPG
eukprot:3901590-Pleurochrysis_carterae.AAC.1